MFGNRRATCRQPHIVLPQNYTLNKTATDAMHSLVNWSHELDWYDETRSWGGVFTIRTNILAVSEVLNRVVQTEDSLAHVQQRTTTRSQLLSQLISTPHRYMAEVEQKLVVLKYIVKVKSELDDNSTMKAMDLLADLVRAFVDYAPTDRPRNVTATTNLVLTISSQLMRCVSSATSEVLRNTYSDSRKLDYAINSMIMASLNTDYVPTAKHIVSDVNGMTIVSHKHTRVRDETISHGNVSFTIPSKLLEHTQGIKASAPCEFLRAHCSCYSDCCYSVCLLYSIVWISSIALCGYPP
ncbi:hypothetical protein EB796_006050 [Bugula neritina]|uniref:Uncharacterized protein n=1 Tax=Bugula neritina TaxID=10212 RepID=A0A7J7KBR2_BUGNE|nr:hypothetical protein EB796_006050 [Bugula neritina]